MTDRQPRVILLDPRDNVVVTVDSLVPGCVVHVGAISVAVVEPIPYAHKMALVSIEPGDAIRKYGQVIGIASRPIPAGVHVHSHNMAFRERPSAHEFALDLHEPVATEPRTFLGYARPDGRVGTRNYVAVLSTVNCSASTSRFIAQGVEALVLERYPAVDGVIALTHKGGCDMVWDGSNHRQLERVLGGFAKHPNIGAYLIVGLGCEVALPEHLVETQGLRAVAREDDLGPRDAPVLRIQERGGIRKTVEAGVAALRELLPEANRAVRTEVPARHLVFGTQCGGSDAYSGITANPAVGAAADRIVAQGGTVILAETPETYGAEHLLTRRARDPRVGEALLERIEWWKWYTSIWGARLDDNPSPGNKDGGLTTIAEKSLGAIAKGGTTTLRDVLLYAEPATTPGLVFMDTPGSDFVSMTGIVAGGANVAAFTTGRGSVYGCKPTPCVKVTSNSITYHRMVDDMDVNAGEILEGRSVQAVGQDLFELVLDVASGRKTKSETLGLGEDEFAPWTIGPVL